MTQIKNTTQAPNYYEERLRQFVIDHEGIFMITDAIDFLGLDRNADGTHHAIPSIVAALKKLNCKTEFTICYIPPHIAQQDGPPVA